MPVTATSQRDRGQIRVHWWRDRGRGGYTEADVREEIIKLAQLERQVLPVNAERLCGCSGSPSQPSAGQTPEPAAADASRAAAAPSQAAGAAPATVQAPARGC